MGSDGDGHDSLLVLVRLGWLRSRGPREKNGSASSRTAPSPPGAASTMRAAASTSRVRVGHGDRPADQLEAREVVDVVAEVGDASSGMSRSERPRRQRRGLVVAALQHLDPQLAGAGGDDGVGLGRQDQHRHPRRAQQADAHAVRAADAHELLAALTDQHRVVGVHAVEVGDDGVHVDRLRCPPGAPTTRGERGRQGQLLLGVDLDRVRLGHQRDADPAEEAVLRAAEARGIHHVEGAGLEELGLAVLPARAAPASWLMPTAPAPSGVVRQRKPHVSTAENTLSDSPARTRSTAASRSAGSMNGEVACRKTTLPGRIPVVELVEGVLRAASELAVSPASLGVARRPRRPPRGRPPRSAVVGGHHDAVDRVAARADGDRARDQRDAADPAEVLAGNAPRRHGPG